MCSRSDCSRRASSTSSFASSNSARGGWSTELLERITDRSTKFSSSRTLPGQWGSDIAFIAEARFLCANRVRDAVERVAGNTGKATHVPEHTYVRNVLKMHGSEGSQVLQLDFGPIVTKNTCLLVDRCRNVDFSSDEQCSIFSPSCNTRTELKLTTLGKYSTLRCY
jgi:hypothetical protein